MKTLFVFISISFSINAQNLVVNGDFELHDSCPNTVSTPSNLQINSCFSWTTPTYATSDYYNSCSPNIAVSVPNNGMGYQQAKSGNGYCGIIPYSGGNFWSEYLLGEIYQPNGKDIYKLSIEVSMSDNSIYAVDQLGVWISDKPFFQMNSSLPITDITPQFVTEPNKPLNDSINWMHFEWLFIADGSEKYILIGRFSECQQSNLFVVDENNTMETYLYIDDVVIEPTGETLEQFNVITPNNDGVNDTWFFPYESTGKTKVYILNRWGDIVREELLTNFYWDGSDKEGTPCSDGVYFYYVSTEEGEKKWSGNVHLIR